jgi:hypothetical protein
LTIRRLYSATQPGRGIRKIIDLYHDLPVLVDRARAYETRRSLSPEEVKELDRSEAAVDLTEDELKERHKT